MNCRTNVAGYATFTGVAVAAGVGVGGICVAVGTGVAVGGIGVAVGGNGAGVGAGKSGEPQPAAKRSALATQTNNFFTVRPNTLTRPRQHSLRGRKECVEFDTGEWRPPVLHRIEPTLLDRVPYAVEVVQKDVSAALLPLFTTPSIEAVVVHGPDRRRVAIIGKGSRRRQYVQMASARNGARFGSDITDA